MSSSGLIQALQVSADLVTTAGIFVASIGLLIAYHTYKAERQNEKLEREFGTFNELDDKYVEFMYRCSEHPKLDLFSVPAIAGRVITDEELRIERALYSVLISIFERAHLMFEYRASEQMKQNQYQGWIECMKSYCMRDSFRHEWLLIGNQFDAGFRAQMDALMQDAQTTAQKPASA